MGNALLKQGKIEEAIEAFKKAISIKPDYAEAYGNIGNAFKDQGKPEDAIEAFKKVISIKPDYDEAYINIGNVFQDQGKIEEAVEAYTKALELKPDNPLTKTNLAISLFESGKFEKASRLFSLDDSIKSQSYLLKCFYELDTQSKFSNQLEYLIKRGENNCIIGSYACRASIKYGIDPVNPLCNNPLKYVKRLT